jgi:hypothetical protein
MPFWDMPPSTSHLALLKTASSSLTQLFALLANQQKRISDDEQFVTCATLALGLTWTEPSAGGQRKVMIILEMADVFVIPAPED